LVFFFFFFFFFSFPCFLTTASPRLKRYSCPHGDRTADDDDDDDGTCCCDDGGQRVEWSAGSAAAQSAPTSTEKAPLPNVTGPP